jgi:AcrR family transcriptional regulator
MSNPKGKSVAKAGSDTAAAPKKKAAKKAPQISGDAGAVRPRGRPARLSQQVVITKTLELLADRRPEEITLALLAEELNTATVSLYKYFPNRDALLDSVAEYFYSLFDFPQAGSKQRWQDTALAWLWAVHAHIQRYPLVSRMYGVEGQLSTAIMKMSAPALHLLARAGLEGSALAFASTWFVNQALGLILNESSAGDFRQPISLRHIVDLPQQDQDIYLALKPHMSAVDSKAVLDFGFNLMIRGLEDLVKKSGKK